MIADTFIYYCSECEQGFQLEEVYDDACPCCGEFQLECINPNNNDAQLSIELTLSQDPPKHEEQP